MFPNRIVAILTPLVFAPLAGWLTAYVARNAPGLPALDPAQVTALFIAGATIAFGKAAQWTHGWQKFESGPDGQVGHTDPDEAEQLAEASLAGVPLEPSGSYSADEAGADVNGAPNSYVYS
jgi:hypothetical protein